ncbi:uncharacterized protein YcbK (DUF882 family) [Rhodovulum imhoffii]|uniref:Murein endopeptidase K n=2 Tax=Rhodovulum imhoffii TaxID=365340 RepID=A0A2T5BVI5_9RHOB|nr:uncharacterized protein YcbK (DUF882 family) [Rhodovulum imhoffii]
MFTVPGGLFKRLGKSRNQQTEDMMLTRRQALCGLGAVSVCALPAPALAISDRELRLIRPRTGESFQGTLVRRGLFSHRLDKEALTKVYWMLRDLRVDKAREMDAELLDLVGRINARIPDRPVQITSAYRTPRTNRSVRGASSSFHMKGQALDIRVEGVSSSLLCKLARSEGAGGVGWYPRRNFVHVDTGPRRDWRG